MPIVNMNSVFTRSLLYYLVFISLYYANALEDISNINRLNEDVPPNNNAKLRLTGSEKDHKNNTVAYFSLHASDDKNLNNFELSTLLYTLDADSKVIPEVNHECSRSSSSGPCFQSSSGQDILLFEVFEGSVDNHFVDLGSGWMHWLIDSNTIALERHRNWTGICIEHDVSSFGSILENRKCILLATNNITVQNWAYDSGPISISHSNSIPPLYHILNLLPIGDRAIDVLSIGRNAASDYDLSILFNSFQIISSRLRITCILLTDPSEDVHNILTDSGYFVLASFPLVINSNSFINSIDYGYGYLPAAKRRGQLLYLHKSFHKFEQLMDKYKQILNDEWNGLSHEYIKTKEEKISDRYKVEEISEAEKILYLSNNLTFAFRQSTCGTSLFIEKVNSFCHLHFASLLERCLHEIFKETQKRLIESFPPEPGNRIGAAALITPIPDDTSYFYIQSNNKLDYRLLKVHVGKGSYGLKNIVAHWWGELNSGLKIGKYVQIANNLQLFLGGNHKYKNVASYPFGSILKPWLSTLNLNLESESYYSKGPIDIGSDVWIGNDVSIMSGVRVGNGAVIGAGAVVRENVPDYAIVIGNPAKIVSFRHNPDQIDKLLTIAWWNWSDAKIISGLGDLANDDIDAFISKYS